MILIFAALAAATAGAASQPARPAYFPADFTQPRIICDPMRPDRREPAIAQSQAEGYANALSSAQEPALAPDGKRAPGAAREVVRLTVLRSFQRPVVVRIEMRGDAARLTARELSGRGGHDPGTIARTAERDLATTDLQQLRALLKSSDLDSLPPKQCDDRASRDGARWLFEHAGRKAGYRLVDRTGTAAGGPLRALALFMTGLTGWPLAEID